VTPEEQYGNKSKQKLYRVEYYEPEDNDTYIEWVWAEPMDFLDYRPGQDISYRKATVEETYLYEEAYEDGYGLAALIEYEHNYNGVTFRVEVGEDGNLVQGHKMFECAVCEKHKDFETEVGMVSNFYLTEIKNEALWHICYECAMITSELEGIKIDTTEEGEANS
jgi:hypothetical protein